MAVEWRMRYRLSVLWRVQPVAFRVVLDVILVLVLRESDHDDDHDHDHDHDHDWSGLAGRLSVIYAATFRSDC
jgi:hypothetical protein